MCGIAGVFHFDQAPVDQGLLERMAKAMHHRGPDDGGFFTDRGVGLAFRRLAIVDLSGGHQPMASDCGRYTIVFNGEIYNHRELRARLEADAGVRFHTSSDTEVILAAWRAWGPDALPRFNGMFALALWDREEQSLVLARDRMGKKPLFFARTARGVVFGSEVKTLFEHPEVPRRVAPERIPTFLAYRYVPGDETLFDGIECLPAASWVKLSARDGLGAPKRYWDYSFEEPQDAAPVETLRDELEALLVDSVRLRAIADVPVGAFLSGGLDSSLVVGLMTREHPEPLKTFSVGFDGGVSETSHAATVAKAFGTDHHELLVDAKQLVASIPEVLHARETPITNTSDIPLFLLARLARTKVTVVLSGEGADEILAGYPKYAFEHQLGPALRALPSGLLNAAAAALPYGLRRAQLALTSSAERDPLERYAGWFGAFGARERRGLLADGSPNHVHAYSERLLGANRPPAPVEEMLYLDTGHWLPANLLLRGDRVTMANSLELRCPFLDYRLVEFAARRLPRRTKIRGMSGKWILKSMAASVLPAPIVSRKKWGFHVPVGEWFRGSLAPVLRDVLLSPAARGRGYFREQAVRDLVDEHVGGRRNHEKQLWTLLQLELWHLMFVDRTLGPGDRIAP